MAGVEAASIFVRVGADLSDLQSGLAGASASLTNFGRNMMRTGAMLSAGITAPLGLLAKASIDEAKRYETNMNLIQATTNATAEQMKQFGDTAVALGADMQLPNVSAADAAAAMLEMAKAGLSVDNVLGAARGTVQLAAAGNLEIADAATIAANTLNAFGLQGEEAMRVADLLAAAANASSASVESLADGYRSAAGIFSASNVPIEDLTTALAQLANAGIDGYHSGTALRRMLLSLENPTDKSKDAMAAIGFSAYDASGKMKSWGTIIGELAPAVKDLTQEQRDSTLATIFGTYAVSAANILLRQGVDGFNEMKTAVTEQGAAAKMATARMKGLQGALEGLRSQAETLALKALLPLLPLFSNIVRSVASFVGGLGELNPNLINAGLAFAAVWMAVGPLLLAIGGLAVLLGFLLTPLGAAVGLFSVLAAFVAANPPVFTMLTEAASALFGVLGGTTSIDTLIGALGTLGSSILAVVLPPLQMLATQIWDWVTTAVAEAPARLAALTAAIVAWATSVAPQVLAAGMQIGQRLAAGIQQALASGLQALDSVLGGRITALFDALAGLVRALAGAIAYLTPKVQALAAAMQNLADVIAQQLSPLLTALEPLFRALGPVVSALAPLIGQVLVFAIGGMIGAWTEAVNLLSGTIPVAVSVAVGAINLLTATILTISTIVSQVVATVTALLAGDWATAWNGALALVVTVTTGITTVAQVFGTGLRGIITTTLTQLGINWQVGWDAIKAALDVVLAAILLAVQTQLLAIKTQLDTSLAEIAAAWSTAWNLLPTDVQNVLASAIAAISTFGSQAATLATSVGSSIVDALWSGMKAKWAEVMAWVGTLPGQITAALSGGLSGAISGAVSGAVGGASGGGGAATGGGDSLTVAQFGDYLRSRGWDEAAIAAACGPIAAAGLAKGFGIAADPSNLLKFAESHGLWDRNSGMHGGGSEMALLSQALGIQTAYESAAKAQRQLAAGQPVIIDTAHHYFVAQGYDPASGKYDLGESGKVYSSVGRYATLDQLSAAAGGLDGFIGNVAGQADAIMNSLALGGGGMGGGALALGSPGGALSDVLGGGAAGSAGGAPGAAAGTDPLSILMQLPVLLQVTIPTALTDLQTKILAWLSIIAGLLTNLWAPAWKAAADDVVQATKLINAAVDETARHVRNLLELLQHVPGAHITIPKIDLPPAPADSGNGSDDSSNPATAAPVTVNVFPQEASLDADQLWRLVNRQLALQGVA